MTKFGLDKCQVERRPIAMHDMVVLELPFPPSVNNLFANGKSGRYTTQQYRDWQTSAGWKVAVEKPGRVPGAVAISLSYEEKNGRRDLDNLIKPVLDLLVKHNVIDGDHRTVVRAINAQWSKSVHGVRVSIMPEAAEKVAA